MRLLRLDNHTIVLDAVQEVRLIEDWNGHYGVEVRYMGSDQFRSVGRFTYLREGARAFSEAQQHPEFLKQMKEEKWMNQGIEWRATQWLKDRGLLAPLTEAAEADENQARIAAEALRDQIEFLLGEVDIQYVSVGELPT